MESDHSNCSYSLYAWSPRIRKKKKVDWRVYLADDVWIWNSRWDKLIYGDSGEEGEDIDMLSDEYVKWYSMITRRLIQPRLEEDDTHGYHPSAHELPSNSSRNRKSVNYMSEVEADDMNMSTENIEESCVGEEQVNLASAYCPQDLSQLDTDQICTPSAINVPGDYLKMGGGFCIDEED
ncbi:hypothetical protein QQ045_023567 [Rhodiola kirilowii]